MASLEDYVIGPKLGFGSYGQVYLITQKHDGKQFALKVIPSKFGLSDLNECDILFRLQHPNLLHGEAFILTDPQNQLQLPDAYNMMLVLELALADMQTFITPEISLATRIRFCWECATAIKMLQDHGVHHLDIKPANVFIFGTPEAPTSKLGDFGLICYGDTTSCQLSGGAFTAGYRPPEEFSFQYETPFLQVYPNPTSIPWSQLDLLPSNEDRKYTAKATIWALASYFYFVLTGQKLITGEYYGGEDNESGFVREAVEKLFTERRKSVLSLLPTPEAQSLLSAMLQYQPEARPTIETVLAHDFFIQAGYTQVVPGLAFESKIPTQLQRKYPIGQIIHILQKVSPRVDIFFLAIDLLYRVIESLANTYKANEIVAGVWTIAASLLTNVLNPFYSIPKERRLQVEADILSLIQGVIYRPNIYTEAWSAWSLQQLAPLVNDPNIYLKVSIPAIASKLALLEPPTEKEARQSKEIKPLALQLVSSQLLNELITSDAMLSPTVSPYP